MKIQLEDMYFWKNFLAIDEAVNRYLLLHKQELLDRKIRKFNEKNWFEWGALRNMKKINQCIGQNCIYVRCITRKESGIYWNSYAI